MPRPLVCLAAVLSLAALLGACHAASGHRAPPPPLGEGEGKVALYVQPLPDELRRLRLTVASVTLVDTEGSEIPLPLEDAMLSGAAPSQVRIAAGRVPARAYSGVSVTFARAQLGDGATAVDLAVPSGAVRASAMFVVKGGAASVLALEVASEPAEAEARFVPRLSLLVPPRPVPDAVGLCSDRGTNDVTVFDKHVRFVRAAVPTGARPEGIALDAPRRRAYVTLAAEDDVQVLDVAAAETIGRIRLAPGDAPRDIAVTRDGARLLVANPGSGTVAFADPQTLAEISRVPAGTGPSRILLDATGRRAYVLARDSSTVTALDVANRSVAATASTDAEPLQAALNRAGTALYVSHRGSTSLSIFRVPDLVLDRRLHVGLGASAIVVDPRSDLLYVGGKGLAGVAVYDPASPLPIDTIALPAAVSEMAVDTVENALFALMPAPRRIAVVDLVSRKVTASFSVGHEPFQLALARPGTPASR